MLIKEYRIPLPLTVEEYRIAQLYMIAKKSRDESSGAGSGVEILINEPYTDGPGGNGQYTRKIYHVGSHLPGWLKGILPKTALMVEEEAWNAYPYTKTRYTCPFVEKFLLEIETYYFNDNGHQDNVFGLTGSDLRERVVDIIDVVKDQLVAGDYVPSEDPTMYVSEKTGRGPLGENWLEEYWHEISNRPLSANNKADTAAPQKSIMCAYKLCRVEFRYWGMQTKIERFIHDVALRKTMLRAHRQAWAWQDEWYGLTMADIREIEHKTQLALKRKMMGQTESDSEDETCDEERELSECAGDDTSLIHHDTEGSVKSEYERAANPTMEMGRISTSLERHTTTTTAGPVSGGETSTHASGGDSNILSTTEKWCGRNLHSPSSTSAKSFNLQVDNWRIESLGQDSDSCSDEFYDCEDASSTSSGCHITKWGSMDLPINEKSSHSTKEQSLQPPNLPLTKLDDSIFSKSFLKRMAIDRSLSMRGYKQPIFKANSLDVSHETSGQNAQKQGTTCTTTTLLIIFHGGSVLDANADLAAKKSDITTLRGALESVIRENYPALFGNIAIRLVACPPICADGLTILSNLSPYSFDVSPSNCEWPQVTQDSIPIGAIPILATCAAEYSEILAETISMANNTYKDFLKTEEGKGFCGQVSFVADSVGSILCYDALCRSKKSKHHGSQDSIIDMPDNLQVNENPGLMSTALHRKSCSADNIFSQPKLEFEVSDFFMFGSPLALVLAYRKMCTHDDKIHPIYRPNCLQVYNLFHPTDPTASRLEPIISARFSLLPPVNVPKYAKYPHGNGQLHNLSEMIHRNPQMFSDILPSRRLSEVSIESTASLLTDSTPLHALSILQQNWWGSKRLDYALYCPDGLSNFPTNALPHLFHSSYWESCDVIAFILRQISGVELAPMVVHKMHDTGEVRMVDGSDALLSHQQKTGDGLPVEKWLRKRTSVKVRNVTANHRANDVIVCESTAQVLGARFMYGPLDMVALTGEKVDIYIMKETPVGEWILIATEVTDKTGRVTHTIPASKSLGYGLYPIKMVVRGDNSSVDFYMAVIPPKTESVVFSIDGSFTASVSVTGRDPKVRAGAVDVVRHWQELGYLIIYITGRPDMQHRRVVSWLSKHNFPHGLVAFADRVSTDPLSHKAAYLNNLVQNHRLIIHCAYGSSKDISVYTGLGLKPNVIFIVGKASKKQHTQATILNDGYAAHLNLLMSHGGSRPAQGNARMVIPRGYFNLSGQNSYARCSRPAKRTTSYPIQEHSPLTTIERSLSMRQQQGSKKVSLTFYNPATGACNDGSCK